VALNSGAGGPVVSVDGVQYNWDEWFSNSNTDAVDSSVAIANTLDDQIYRGYRWGFNFEYAIPVQNNLEYLVTLKFAEVYHNAAGMRKFSVSMEGEAKIASLDVFATAGGKNIAYDETHTMIVRDGVMNIQFTTSVDHAMIAGIYIRPKVAPSAPLTPPVQPPVAGPVSTPKAPMATDPSPVKAPVSTPSAPVPKAPVPAPVLAPVPMPKAPVRVPTPSGALPTVPPVPVPAPVPVPTGPTAPIPKEPTIPPRNSRPPTRPPTRKVRFPKIRSFLKRLLGIGK
jgi:Malectin domain